MSEEEDEEIMALIDETGKTKKYDKERLKRSEQKDQKVHQRQEKIQTTGKIQRILEEFKGIKEYLEHQISEERTLIPKIKNEKGEVITSRKGTANVFGELYSKLYADDQCEKTGDGKMTKRSKCRCGREERNSRVQQQKSCRLLLTDSKKEKQETATE